MSTEEFDFSQHTPNRAFVENVIKQLAEVEKNIGNVDDSLVYANPKDNFKTTNLVLPLLPSDLNTAAREMLMRSMNNNMDTDLMQTLQQVSRDQYNLMFNEIKPRLMLIRRLQDMIDQYQMTQYGQVDTAIYQKLAQILADTEDPVKRYLTNRDTIMGKVEEMMKVKVLNG